MQYFYYFFTTKIDLFMSKSINYRIGRAIVRTEKTLSFFLLVLVRTIGQHHTVMYVGDQDFHGTVTMQATLASEPTESDWFTVDGTTISYNPLDVRTTSTVDSFNFVGNFVWVRSKIDIDAGSVYTVQYNH